MNWKRLAYAAFIVVVAGVAALAGAAAGGFAVYSALQSKPTALAPTAAVAPALPVLPPAAPAAQPTSAENTVIQVVAQVGPSVVTVVGKTPDQQTFFGWVSGDTVSGSGVIISADGIILTNNHVIENVDQINIVLADGKELPARLVGTDAYSDLAVLKVDGEVPAAANMGNSDSLRTGETVIAMGSPLGDFKNTVTVGVVSATGRSLDTGKGFLMEGLIQTDAAINSGNSGGPLLNLFGEVIGLNSMIVRNGGGGNIVEGLGFAIPSNMVVAVAEQIIRGGSVARPSLSIRWQAITPDLAARYSLPVEWGAYVSQVRSGSESAAAGLQSGDIITKINDNAINEKNPFVNVLFRFKPGETVRLTVARGSQTLQVEVKLGKESDI